MKSLILVFCVFICAKSVAQEKLVFQVKFLKESLLETKNENYLNRRLYFLDQKDTIVLNFKAPFDSAKNEFQDMGIYYNCHLKEGIIYTFRMRKICLSEIPEKEESYYKTNASFYDDSNCSSFSEIYSDTGFKYAGNYGMYFDKGNQLYEIENLLPTDDCFFGHQP